MSGPQRDESQVSGPPAAQSLIPQSLIPQGRRLNGGAPRDPGDAWVTAEDGNQYWGRFGAAGLLAFDTDRGILLQHRVEWSHHGNTWGIPGGARHQGEDAVAGAVRESHEEAGVPLDAVRPRFTYTIDRGGWTYVTVIAEVTQPFEPEITDPESKELAWVAIDAVESYDLHPGFGRSWPLLRALLEDGADSLADDRLFQSRLARL